jgi:hypothetical protein
MHNSDLASTRGIRFIAIRITDILGRLLEPLVSYSAIA